MKAEDGMKGRKAKKGRKGMEDDLPSADRKACRGQASIGRWPTISPSPNPSSSSSPSSFILFFTFLPFLAFLAACNTGSYPLDVFPEMHYQPSYRPLEPERLSAPDGAVPVTGAPPKLTFAEAAGLVNPVSRAAESLGWAGEVYRVNCAVCHGPDGRGRGTLARYYAGSSAAVVQPTDFASPRVRGRTDGQLWWIVRHGLGNMPPYEDLLTEEETWLMVLFIREVQGR